MTIIQSPIIQNTATHLITGFLGSGKTTFLNNLIAHFQHDDKWAILINEAGKIGIDGSLINKNVNLVTKEISGGCICCTSQLPLQIALARLLSGHKPNRLIIEPTGLAHPKELSEQLSAPHWQTALSLKTRFCIMNARYWQQEKYQNHEHYQSHIQYSDVVIVNRFDELNNKQLLINWIKNLNANATIFWQKTDKFDTDFIEQLSPILDNPSLLTAKPNRQIFSLKPNFNATKPITTTTPELQPTEPPFRYCEDFGDYQIIGWQLPKDWTTDIYQLTDFLLTIPNYQRIKGVVNTQTGWQRLNFTDDSVNIASGAEQIDNRIEVIFDGQQRIDFLAYDEKLNQIFYQN